jgi:hypothetical protein
MGDVRWFVITGNPKSVERFEREGWKICAAYASGTLPYPKQYWIRFVLTCPCGKEKRNGSDEADDAGGNGARGMAKAGLLSHVRRKADEGGAQHGGAG